MFLVLVLWPSPLVNTIPKSCVAAILPSPNLIILSFTVRLVAWVVITLPLTVKLPNKDVFPATVKLSPIFTSDVAWPILTTEPESCAPKFNAPAVCILPFVPS